MKPTAHWPLPLFQKVYFGQNLRLLPLMEKLGNPHKNLPHIIHVAGTNGKGSTVAILKKIFESAGYKVHAYISPPLAFFNERIYLAGKYINSRMAYEILEECRIAAESLNIMPTFFEGYTAAAFLAFSRVKADIILLEVGLGGRLDATNIAENVIMSIITPISYDHMEYLGHKLENIAFEKAGIIRPEVPVISSLQDQVVSRLLIDRAFELKSPLKLYEYDFIVDRILLNNEEKLLHKSKEFGEMLFSKPSLHGIHQYLNVSCVIEAAMMLKRVFTKINNNIINDAIKNLVWLGRLHKVDYGKYYDLLDKNNIELWVDGAHNKHGASVVADWIDVNYNNILIIGLTKNRKPEDFLPYFQGKVTHIYAVRIQDEPSSMDPEILKNIAIKFGFHASSFEDLSEAFQDIIDNYRNIRVVAIGSLFLAGMILREKILTFI